MTKSEIMESPVKDLDSTRLCNIQDETSVQRFYNPLSVTGYLTPLQRKKLREKRGDFSIDLKETSDVKNKRTVAVKRKKRTNSVLRDRNKDQIKRMKTKENTQQVQYSISKIVHKKTDDIKTKKFFKSSTADRINKANFTMPFVLKKNTFHDINRSVRETLAHTGKLSQHSENSNILRQTHISAEQENEENSIPDAKKFIFEFDWPSDEELLKRMERARQLVRQKNVLREANNIHKFSGIENENKEQNNEGSQVKFYPIFQVALKKQLKNNETKRIVKNINKKIKASSCEQMIIDAGQKEIGPKICSICNMIYTIGQEEDERLHLNYHNMHITNLKFPGWKEESVIGEYCDGRVIMIRNSDKSFKLKKVEEVLQVANRDLGFSSSAVPVKPDLAFLLFISNDKVVAGCVVAEPISKAFQVLLVGSESIPNTKENDGKANNWCSSSEAIPAICGVNRIWVAHNFRRHKVASRMVDCLRCHFIHGHVIGIREIAFTDPSPDGRQFAASYTGTSNFLVYK